MASEGGGGGGGASSSAGGCESGTDWLDKYTTKVIASAAWLDNAPPPESEWTLVQQNTISKTAARKKRREAIKKNITSIKPLFAPIAVLLKLKRDDMVAGVKAAGNFQDWLESGGAASFSAPEEDADKAAALDEGMDHKMNVWRAFADKPDQDAWHRAADYSDSFFRAEKSEFNVYYVCLRKWDAAGTDRCNTATNSFVWDRLHDDPLASKQRWYCPVCGKRYTTTYGVIVELIDRTATPAVAMYAKADFPPQDIQDLKALCVQQKLREAKSPKELLDSLPWMKIADQTNIFTKEKDGVFRFGNDTRESLPQLEWYQLYNLVKDD